MYKLMALDMDGTLLDSDKRIRQSAIDALAKAHKTGCEIIFSTGRAIAELTEYLADVPFVHYGVCESGALLYDFQKQTIIDQVAFPPEIIDAVIAAVAYEKPMVQMMSRGMPHVSAEDITHMADFHMGIYQTMFERVATTRSDIMQTMREHKTEIEKINLFHRSPASRERTYQRLEHLPVDLVYAEETSLELSPLGVTKGDGLSRLCAYLQIDLKEAVAVGDADNDLDVLKRAGLAIAMGNANDRVKSLCDAVVADNDHEGIAEAVDQYVLGR